MKIAILKYGIAAANGCTLQRQNTENSTQIFPEKELRGLSPISTFLVALPIFCCRKICGPIL
jgi:hypothetical protein